MSETNGTQAPEARDLYRCDIPNCGAIVTLADIEAGGCVNCGGRRMREFRRMTEAEWDALIARGAVFAKERWGEVK